jgi:hypothetical protein
MRYVVGCRRITAPQARPYARTQCPAATAPVGARSKIPSRQGAGSAERTADRAGAATSSRKVVGWSVGDTLDAELSDEALRRAFLKAPTARPHLPLLIGASSSRRGASVDCWPARERGWAGRATAGTTRSLRVSSRHSSSRGRRSHLVLSRRRGDRVIRLWELGQTGPINPRGC